MLLNATVQEIVDFVCKFMYAFDADTEITKPLEEFKEWDSENLFTDVRLLNFSMEGEDGYVFEFGHAQVFSLTRQQGTLFDTTVHVYDIDKYTEGDSLENARWLEKFQTNFTELKLELQKRFPDETTTKEPPKPKTKSEGGTVDPWLVWRESRLSLNYKCTFEDVANESGFSKTYIRQKSMVYEAGKDKPKTNKKRTL